VGWSAIGCGDETVCPSGTAGSPCRYTTGVGDPPALLPPSDVNGADAFDGEVTVPDTTSETQNAGDIEVLDGADSTEGPDADLDVSDVDSDPSADAEEVEQ
jgi:hypothetical protein